MINLRYSASGLQTMWGHTFLPAEYAERSDALRAITQTCRTLRRKFLPWLWERVEACVTPECDAWYIALGNVLESKCHILLKNPPLATHVRQVIINAFPLFHLTLYHTKHYVGHRHPLQNGYHPPCFCRLSPVLTKPSHFGTMSCSSRDDDEAQECVRGSNDTPHSDCCSAHSRSPHSPIMSKRRGCDLYRWRWQPNPWYHRDQVS